ncbi:integrase, catalytic region, zinc finger, CCHC-type containing protein [Tanacetum coccineum]|uniref:Integrase, catalytic region, zinc finger, CCHC-type containing protein n=1 Tax=Tanacetum coccineum TaxID=301880 RepID=A0ABQ5AGV0_9ASTR
MERILYSPSKNDHFKWERSQDVIAGGIEGAENDLALNLGHVFEADESDLSKPDVDEYVEDNEEHVVQSNVSSVRNDALMSILDELHEQGVQSRLANKPDMVVNDSVTSELARYKELIWKPKGRLSDNSLYKTKRVWKATGKLFADIGYQWRPTGKKLTLGKLDCRTGHALVSGLRLFKTYDGESFKAHEFCGKFIGCDPHSKYTTRGTWTQSISEGQVCDSELEVLQKAHFALFVILRVGLNKTVRFIRTDNGTEFINQVMSEFYEGVGIFHQKSVPRTPQQNAFCVTTPRTDRSLIHTRHNKTPYELVHDKKPDLTFLRVFGALCYPTNDSEDLGKFQAKADIGIFVGSGPEPIMMTPGQLNSGLAPSPVPATTYIPPTDKDLEILFQPMFDEYFDQSTDSEPVPTATVVNAPIVSTNTSVSTTIAQDAPSTSHSLSSSQVHPPVFPQGVAAGPTIEDTSITQADLHPSVNPVAGEPSSAQSTSGDVSLAEPNQVTQPPDHLRRWTKDHPLDNIVGNPSRPVIYRGENS